MLDLIFLEIRDALRAIRKKSQLTLIAVLIVALGLTAVTTVFSIINFLVLIPQGYVEPERLIGVEESDRQININNYSTWLSDVSSFEATAAFKIEAFYISGGKEPERKAGVRVSRTLFPLIGVQPVLGRAFTKEENISGMGMAVILGNSYWKKNFGGSKQVLGKTLMVNETPYTIVGVMPRGFTFPLKWEPDIWVPFGSPEEYVLPGKSPFVSLICRLKKGISLDQAQSQVNVISSRTGIKNYKMTLFHQERMMTWADFSTGTKLLVGAAAFVMLICCVNISNLLASRGADRAKEISIRRALGASRVSLIRQFLFESTIIFILGSGCAIIFTSWILEFIPITVPIHLTFNVDSHIDGRILCFVFLFSFLTALLSGLLPALRSSKASFSQALNEGGHRTQTDLSGRRIQKVLAIVQVAVSVCLLLGSGLLIRTLMKLYNVDPGFNPANITTLHVALSPYKYKNSDQWVHFFDQLLENVKQIPGIESSASTTNLPMSGTHRSNRILMSDRKKFNEPLAIYSHSISPDYFRTMKIPVRLGREFSNRDSASSPAVAIVNEKMAKQLFGTIDVIGRTVSLEDEATERRIVGVALNVRHFGLSEQTESEMYLPYTQDSWLWMTTIVRSTRSPESLAADLRKAVWKIDSDQPATLSTMEDEIKESLGDRRILGLSLTVFAALSLFLTCVGVYGVVLYSVVRRTYEIGVRVAVGARSTDILNIFLKETGAFILIGITLGVVLALNMAKILDSFLWNVPGTDFSVYLTVVLSMLLSSALACWLPIRRALKINPVHALRYE